MKRVLISAITVMAFFLGGITAFSQEEEVFCEVEASRFPQPRYEQTASLMSYDAELEEVLKAGWDNLSSEINISKFCIHKDDIGEVYQGILGENPLYYYVNGGFQYYSSSFTGYVTRIIVKYTETDKAVIEEYKEQLNAATEEILFLIKEGMSDFEKVMTVHDYMALNYEYDLTYSNYDISIMTTKTGVCQAYSYAFKHLMNCLGIDCTYVISSSMNHMWNLVKIDGKWYHIDVTWDDPISDKFGQVRHTYALLSTACITSLSEPHYGFSLGDASADSEIYHDASWHTGVGEVVYYDEKTYWFDGNDLVCSDGSIIYEDIVSENKWSVSSTSYLNGICAGLAEYNGKLYFNSPNKIYEYDILKKTTKAIHSDTAICGLFVNNNVLYYSYYNIENKTIEKKDEIVLGDFSINEPHRENGKIVTRICNTSGKPLIAIAFNADGFESVSLTNKGVSTASFDIQNSADVFVWDENLHPLIPKKKVE